MTTAHRPTYDPAKGKADQGGNRFLQPTVQTSSRDMPSHQTLKIRQDGQNTAEEMAKRDLKKELLEREERARSGVTESIDSSLPHPPDDVLRDKKHAIDFRDGGQVGGDNKGDESVANKLKAIDYSKDDADDESDDDSGDDSDDSDDDSDSDDSDDDDAELMAELARIKRERAEEAARKEREELEAKEQERQEAVARGNPLLDLQGGGASVDHTVKRRWDDDTVFKNTCSGERKQKKRFINDTVRNDFHKRFLSKYIN